MQVRRWHHSDGSNSNKKFQDNVMFGEVDTKWMCFRQDRETGMIVYTVVNIGND